LQNRWNHFDMSKQSTVFDLNLISVSERAGAPLHTQVYGALREAILSQRLKPGTRLPSTRAFAQSSGVSRNTVLNAFDQLLAEGYIESRVGDGSYVSTKLPDELLSVNARHDAAPQARMRRSTAPPASPHPAPAVSQRQTAVMDGPDGGASTVVAARAFRTGVTAVDAFPTEIWARLYSRRIRKSAHDVLVYGNAAGYQPLRETIAAYLGATRGVLCTADQVVITTASQEALNAATQLLINDGDGVWMEDPGYQGARSALLAAGARLTPVPVDGDGLRVDIGQREAPNARLAYVTPSYQYPTGVTMTLARRLALLDWAARTGAWILEDDYNSEYRFRGRPIASLQGLDTHNRVIYIGTFSKVIFGSLRVGYLVLPPQLIDPVLRSRRANHLYTSTLDQAVLNDFISEGYFARHIRRMRELYASRREILLKQLEIEMPGLFDINCADAGLHVLARLPKGVNDRAIANAAGTLGVEAHALSSYSMLPVTRGGLTLGYGGVNERQIRDGVRKLRQATA
jgi:GntR family transcriptional regulator / MocR family aminotransferase